MTDLTAADVLCSIAAYGLPGSRFRAPSAVLGRDKWIALVNGARWERIVPLLAQAVADGALPASEEQWDEVAALDVQSMNGVIALEAALVGIAADLEQAGVRYRVLKGSAVAHLDYPDPGWREFGDIDLLIHPDHVELAIATLAEQGYARRFPEPRTGFDRRFTKSVSVADSNGQQLDLHRTLAAGGFGQRIIVDMLWSASPSEFLVAGRSLPALGPEERLLHACYHMVLGNAPPRLVPQRDLAQMLLTGNVAADQARLLAGAWQGEAVVAHAVTTAWQNLRLTGDVPLWAWAAEFVPRRRDRRELARATSPNYSYAAQAVDSIMAIRGSRARLAYVSAMAFPRRSYVASRHTGFGSRVRYAVSEVVHARTITKENR
jgi:Uncharacterised nucleotidyltransferase